MSSLTLFWFVMFLCCQIIELKIHSQFTQSLYIFPWEKKMKKKYFYKTCFIYMTCINVKDISRGPIWLFFIKEKFCKTYLEKKKTLLDKKLNVLKNVFFLKWIFLISFFSLPLSSNQLNNIKKTEGLISNENFSKNCQIFFF